MLPPAPVPNLVVRQAGLALATPQAFFHAMFRFGHTAEFGEGGLGLRIAQIVIRFDDLAVAVPMADHD